MLRQQNKYFVYIGTYTDGKSEGIYGYSIDTATGKLIPMGVMVKIGSPTYMKVSKNGKFLYSICRKDIVGNNLCVVDLGMDKIITYNLNHTNEALVNCEKLSIEISAGSGPRHMEFHPNGKFAYLINELSSDILVFGYSPFGFSFRKIQTISALPEGYIEKNYCAAIHISQGGDFLYASNRGQDSIAVFKIDKLSGCLELIEHTSTMGEWPRDFAIDPTGKFLIAANQNSDTIVLYEIKGESGRLKPIESLYVPNPVCVKFVWR